MGRNHGHRFVEHGHAGGRARAVGALDPEGDVGHLDHVPGPDGQGIGHLGAVQHRAVVAAQILHRGHGPVDDDLGVTPRHAGLDQFQGRVVGPPDQVVAFHQGVPKFGVVDHSYQCQIHGVPLIPMVIIQQTLPTHDQGKRRISPTEGGFKNQ